ncbi:kinase-like protein [Obba rivulosa]|uniref:Kinase-like protein n=1 Tax=Obba rivulosa TaxID=1052685 RepID=A0A8E2AW78_9APHY|nr:kinase-like protein [Obba rivulosa]
MKRVISRTVPGSTSSHCITLLHHFTQPGKQATDDSPLPFPLAKRILLHILRGIAHMHKCGVVHTDLKRDNILFDLGPLTDKDIDAMILANPPHRHPPEESGDGIVRATVSQPLPAPDISDLMEHSFFISDFGSAQPLETHLTDKITADALRPPEAILRGPWNEKVFETVVRREFFKHEAYPDHGLDEEVGHLWQILCFTGERFSPEQLQASHRAPEFFDYTCRLKSHPPNFYNPFDMSIRNYKILEESDVLATTSIMKRCLRSNLDDRASAEELLRDPFWDGVD